MQIIKQLDPLRSARAALPGPVALVPTMGALHEGHLTLVRAARERAASVVVSIFVNPLQFGANEDLAAYPRRLTDDAAMLEAEGVELVWAPDGEAMCPAGFATNISVAGVSESLCGASRPGHFDGVATVVCKLFHQVLPDVALFGEKDWQQLAVIRRMARDLDLTRPAAADILGIPTVRESDGLAMSSRNAYLTQEERARAAELPRLMRFAIELMMTGSDVGFVKGLLADELACAGFDVDYAEVADAETLAPLTALTARPARLLVAARLGRARLIDNLAVG